MRYEVYGDKTLIAQVDAASYNSVGRIVVDGGIRITHKWLSTWLATLPAGTEVTRVTVVRRLKGTPSIGSPWNSSSYGAKFSGFEQRGGKWTSIPNLSTTRIDC